MPYTIRRDGQKHCVHKVSDGKRMGCHDTRDGAVSQIAAIEASENKDMDTIYLDPHSLSAVVAREPREEVSNKEVPSSVISFDELEEANRASDMVGHVSRMTEEFSQMVSNIVMNDGIDREAALNRLVREFLQRIESISAIQHNMKEESHDKAAIKREGGIDFPRGDFAFVPDPSKPSTWKLRLTESPGKVTRAQLARAAAALSPGGFRGNRVQLPAEVVSAVKRRIRAEYRKLGVSPREIPTSVKEASEESDFMVWKGNDGLFRWMAIYSNNFRDDDSVPEIISEKSHKTFEYLVDNGIVDYPEVWLWHIPGTAWGKADMITYSDGFAIAAGHVYEGKEFVAEALSKSAREGSDIAVSHGMPANWLVRDPEDPTIINFHITNEISPLPRVAAANKMTGFVVFTNGENDMGIPANKKEWLQETAGLSPEWIERLESGLAKQRDEATESGIESKESAEVDAVAEMEMIADEVEEEVSEPVAEVEPEQEPVAEVEPEPEPEKVQEPEPVAEAKEASVTREEIADVLAAVIKSNEEAVASLESRIKELEVGIKELQKTDEEKIVAMKEQTPTLSLSHLLSTRIIGSDEARLDGRTSLAKEGPEEKEYAPRGYTPSPLLNRLMSGSQDTVER